MKIGDLVWHRDDIKDGIPVPGLVVGRDKYDFIIVRFADLDIVESHDCNELTEDLDAPAR